MRDSKHELAHSPFLEWALGLLTILSAIALGSLLITAFFGVFMRYVFNAPILGSNEIIQFASVVLVMLALPGAAHREMHIRVDVLDSVIGRIGRFIGDLLARAISIYLLTVLSWRAWAKMLDAMEFEDATNMLSLPFWPFYGLLVLGSVLYALVLLIQVIDIVRMGAARSE